MRLRIVILLFRTEFCSKLCNSINVESSRLDRSIPKTNNWRSYGNTETPPELFDNLAQPILHKFNDIAIFQFIRLHHALLSLLSLKLSRRQQKQQLYLYPSTKLNFHKLEIKKSRVQGCPK